MNRSLRMPMLDHDVLDAIATDAFRAEKPCPWVNPVGVITDEAWQELRASLPDLKLFREHFGHARRFGQDPHDKYVLKYRSNVPVAAVWHQLAREIRSEPYVSFAQRLCGTRHVVLNMRWVYTTTGSSVSPHCDSREKLATHLFYMNDASDWEREWGGPTLFLESDRRMRRGSAPQFSDFERHTASEMLGNRSLFFTRTSRSWHGVEPLRCPEGRFRKVFSVVVRANGPLTRASRRARWRAARHVRNIRKLLRGE